MTMTELPPGTKGGLKQIWLRQHKEEILKHARANGVEATLRHYNMTSATFHRLLKSKHVKLELTEAERALMMAKITREDYREMRREIAELRQDYLIFQDEVSKQLTEKLFKPLLSFLVELPPELLERSSDPLAVSRLLESSGKKRRKG